VRAPDVTLIAEGAWDDQEACCKKQIAAALRLVWRLGTEEGIERSADWLVQRYAAELASGKPTYQRWRDAADHVRALLPDAATAKERGE
jgi:hypothetical protein